MVRTCGDDFEAARGRRLLYFLDELPDRLQLEDLYHTRLPVNVNDIDEDLRVTCVVLCLSNMTLTLLSETTMMIIMMTIMINTNTNASIYIYH